jgi:hypothetical protein
LHPRRGTGAGVSFEDTLRYLYPEQRTSADGVR